MVTGQQHRVRLRLGAGPRDGGARGATWSAGRGSRSVTMGATLALASGVVHDLRDPDGILRPLLHSAAARLAESGRRGIDRLGRRYLRLDPPTPAPGVTAERGAGAEVVDAEFVDEDEEEPL